MSPKIFEKVQKKLGEQDVYDLLPNNFVGEAPAPPAPSVPAPMNAGSGVLLTRHDGKVEQEKQANGGFFHFVPHCKHRLLGRLPAMHNDSSQLSIQREGITSFLLSLRNIYLYVIVRPQSTVEYTSVTSVSTVNCVLTNLIHDRC